MQKNSGIKRTAKALTLPLALIFAGIGFVIWYCFFSSILTVGFAAETYQRNPAWSPDGKYIAFECGYSYPLDGRDYISRNNPRWYLYTSDICVFSMENAKSDRLTRGRFKSHPIWSLDGATLAWFDGLRDSFVKFDFLTKKTSEIKLPENSCFMWIGDVEYVQTDLGQTVFSPCHKLVLDLNSMEFIHATREQAETYEHPFDTIIKSPDGRYTAILTDSLSQGKGAAFKGYELSVKEGEREIYKANFKTYANLEWVANGDFLMFYKFNGFDSPETEIVFLYPPTGETRTAKFSLPDSYFRWIPDRDLLALISEKELTLVQFTFGESPFGVKTNERSFLLTGMHGNNFTWSPDGQFVYFTSWEILEQTEDWYDTGLEKIWLLDWENDSAPRLLDDFYKSGVEK